MKLCKSKFYDHPAPCLANHIANNLINMPRPRAPTTVVEPHEILPSQQVLRERRTSDSLGDIFWTGNGNDEATRRTGCGRTGSGRTGRKRTEGLTAWEELAGVEYFARVGLKSLN